MRILLLCIASCFAIACGAPCSTTVVDPICDTDDQCKAIDYVCPSMGDGRLQNDLAKCVSGRCQGATDRVRGLCKPTSVSSGKAGSQLQFCLP